MLQQNVKMFQLRRILTVLRKFLQNTKKTRSSGKSLVEHSLFQSHFH